MTTGKSEQQFNLERRPKTGGPSVTRILVTQIFLKLP